MEPKTPKTTPETAPAAEPECDDGVKRNGLDFRAGWVEGLQAFLTQLRIKAARCKKNEAAGLQAAFDEAFQMRQSMLEKMKGGG